MNISGNWKNRIMEAFIGFLFLFCGSLWTYLAITRNNISNELTGIVVVLATTIAIIGFIIIADAFTIYDNKDKYN